MKRLRGVRYLMTVAAILLLPAVALAEVSVQLDNRGRFKRFWYLTGGRGQNAVIWKQLRSGLSPVFVLNPLGDNLGDKAPVIQSSPLTGYPLAVWPKNFGNIRQLAESAWIGDRWSEISLIAPDKALVYDEQEPSLACDRSGVPYLVWTRAEQVARVYFSMKLLGRWTPPVPISEEGVEGRAPSITVLGTIAVITYKTPAGPVTKNYETSVLMKSAAGLMDNPIPPLFGPPSAPPGTDPLPGGGSNTPGHRL
jgi:hypothetical protein